MAADLAPIVVGYDGSPSSRAAVHWATAEALRVEAPLRIVEALNLGGTHPGPHHTGPRKVLRRARRNALDALAASIRLQHPELRVDTHIDDGSAAAVLLTDAENARMIVIGSHHAGGWAGPLAHSVAVQVVTHAQCPVVALPHHPSAGAGTRTETGPTIVVGVDGSKASAHAIDFAFGRADALHAQLIVLHAWITPFLVSTGGRPRALQFDEQEFTENARLMVSESVAGAAADHPDVSWSTLLVSGSAAEWLVHLSETADLVVTGTRGHGDLTGFLLGSICRHLLHHSHSPTAVIR